MRHGLSGRKLNRTSSHRKALFQNMVQAMVAHEHIKTTLPKAKELRPIVEKYVTLCKENTLANRRLALSRLQCEDTVKKLIDDLSPRFKNRAGGYTRIVKCGFRHGDNAPMAIIQFVEDEVETSKPSHKPKKAPLEELSADKIMVATVEESTDVIVEAVSEESTDVALESTDASENDAAIEEIQDISSETEDNKN